MEKTNSKKKPKYELTDLSISERDKIIDTIKETIVPKEPFEQEELLKELSIDTNCKISGLKKQLKKEIEIEKNNKEKLESKSKRLTREAKKSMIENTKKSGSIKDLFLTYIFLKDKREAEELIAKEIEKKNHIYSLKNDNKPEVWIYKNGIYSPNGISEIKIQIRNILESSYHESIIKEIIAKIQTDTMIDTDEFLKKIHDKKNINLLPMQNGIFNLETKKIIPFDPSYIFLNKLPISYNPKATCPNIEKHFKAILNKEEEINLLYEIIGFCFWKDYFIEKAIIFEGDGRNGKSKTQELIRRLVGVENCCAVPVSEITEDSFSVSVLFGKMINLAGDLSNIEMKETGLLKRSIGRDVLSCKRKFMNNLDFINYAKHIFSCNELPKVYDMTKGFWERWVIIKFKNEFVQKTDWDKLSESDKKIKKLIDTEIINKITTTEELEGLFIKALTGLDTIRKNKEFSYSTSSNEIKRFWKSKSDSFLVFAEENIEKGEDGNYITKQEVRNIYHSYCQKHKVKGASDKAIKVILEENFGVSEDRNYIPTDIKINDKIQYKQEYIWLGIKWKDNSEFLNQLKVITKAKKEGKL